MEKRKDAFSIEEKYDTIIPYKLCIFRRFILLPTYFLIRSLIFVLYVTEKM